MKKNNNDDKLGRFANPIVIRLSHLGNVILPLNDFETETDLSNGVLIDNEQKEHYGFVVITDYNNNQSEEVYRTDNKIIGVQTSDGKLKVYEENRRHPWIFMKNGQMIEGNSATINFGQKKCSLDMTPSGHLKRNDGLIKIIINTVKDSIIIDANGVLYPVIPGVVLGDDYYGINIEIIQKNAKGELETIKKSYFTEDSLYGINAESSYPGSKKVALDLDEITSISVYERDKYHPWKFSGTGDLLQEASYNAYSRQDQAAYLEKYGEKLPKQKHR